MEQEGKFDLERFKQVGPEVREHQVLLLQMLDHEVFVKQNGDLLATKVASHHPLHH